MNSRAARKIRGRTRRSACLALGACLVAAAWSPASLHAQLTLRVSGPPVATGAAIHVAGSFNGWNPNAPDFVPALQSDGTFALTLPDTVRGPVEFKFTLGSWETVETTVSGEDIANRAFTIPATGAATVSAVVGAWRTSSPRAPTKSTASASVTVLSDSFPIPQLQRTRRIWLYLPPGYATSHRRYPVLYIQDGQNVFDAATAFAGEWGVDETLDSLQARGDGGAIVVAVDNDGAHRLDEYDPWINANHTYGGGEGDAYVEFLARTLKPYIDRHYRTRTDPRNTGIMGSSMGGLISLYAALKYPGVFGRAGVFSCACWIAESSLLAYVRAARPHRPAPRFYFVSGEHETPSGQPAREQLHVVDALISAGVPRGSVKALTRTDGAHAEWFWRREFADAYRWMFDAPKAMHRRQ